MKKDDAAVLNPTHNSTFYPICIVIEPVHSRRIIGDDLISKPQRIETRQQVLVCIGRTKNLLPVRSKGFCACPDLGSPLASREQWERGMIPGVIADRMSGGSHFLHNIGMTLCSLTHHEKCRLRTMLLQNIKKARGENRVRTIVESKSYRRL